MNRDPRRVVLITGASRGIGEACARRFAAAGDRLALLARPSPDLERIGRDLDALTVGCDLADEAQIHTALETVERSCGAVDVLVNNAGIVHRHEVDGHSTAAWDHVLAVNLRAPFLLARGVLPGMLARGAGRILNVSSISGSGGTPSLAAYCASKAGLLGFTRALSAEVKGRGIVVAAVSPGSVDTDMLVGSGFAPDMSPSDIAEIVLFLADGPASLTGASIEAFA
jgi:NAD(P)-dependent dehydrogenase (short-subunit alcohol dehydrogenase family)